MKNGKALGMMLKNNSSKNENLLKMYFPQASQDEDEFVSSSETYLEKVALHHFLTNESSAVMVPSE